MDWTCRRLLVLPSVVWLTGCQPFTRQEPAVSFPPRDEGASFFGSESKAVERGRFPPVTFASGRFDLDGTEQEKIRRVARSLRAGERLLLGGFSADEGSPEYCRVLSARRTLAVRDALLRAGVDTSLIQAAGYGDDWPGMPDRLPRVEFAVMTGD
jgi:outer membrane protein OmpA-like peptidoglycan-associated protein